MFHRVQFNYFFDFPQDVITRKGDFKQAIYNGTPTPHPSPTKKKKKKKQNINKTSPDYVYFLILLLSGLSYLMIKDNILPVFNFVKIIQICMAYFHIKIIE